MAAGRFAFAGFPLASRTRSRPLGYHAGQGKAGAGVKPIEERGSWKAGIERFSPAYLGLAAVFGSVFALFTLVGPLDRLATEGGPGEAFLLAFLIGDAVANAAIALASRTKGLHLPVIVSFVGGGAMACGFIVVSLVFLAELDPFGGALAGGLLTGVGNAPFVIMWGKLYGSRTRNETIAYASLSFGIAALVKYALSLLASRPVILLAWMALLLLVAMACQARCLASDMRSPIFNLPEQGRSSSLRTAFRLLWRPFWGVLLCSFIGGLTWGAAAAGAELSVSLTASLTTIVVAGLGVASIFAFGGYFSFDNLPRIVLPVAAGILLVLPFLEDAVAGTVAHTLLSAPYSAVVLFFDVCAWTMLALACERSNVAAETLFGAGRGLQAFTMAAGIVLYHMVGPAERILCLVLTTAYLIALCVAGTGAHDSTRKSRANAPAASPYEQSCVNLARTFELSPRETEVLFHLGRGHSSTYIGKTLFLSNDTVKTHVKHIYRKFGVGSREELIDAIAAYEKRLA